MSDTTVAPVIEAPDKEAPVQDALKEKEPVQIKEERVSDDEAILADLTGEETPKEEKKPKAKKEEKPKEEPKADEEKLDEKPPEKKEEKKEEKPDELAELKAKVNELTEKLAKREETEKPKEDEDEVSEFEPGKKPDGWNEFSVDLKEDDYDLPTERSLASATVKVASEVENVRLGLNYVANAVAQLAKQMYATEIQGRAAQIFQTIDAGGKMIEEEFGEKIEQKDLAKLVHQYASTIEGSLTAEAVKDVWTRANYKKILELTKKNAGLNSEKKGADEEVTPKKSPEMNPKSVPSGKRQFKNDDEEILAALRGELE